MIRDYILTAILILYPLALKFAGRKKSFTGNKNTAAYYGKGIAEYAAFLLLFYLLDPHCFLKINFDQVGKGIIIDQDIFYGILNIFYIPVCFALFFKKTFETTTGESTEVFGYPVQLLPATYKALFVFTISIIARVIFEELFFRQFVFYFFYKSFGLKGDLLLLTSSFIFTFVHHYKKAGAILTIFIIGLLLGKAYLYSGTLLYPIILHLFLNMTVVVLAWKRINKKPASLKQ